MLLNSFNELYAYYYWMWISPLLLENCCLCMGNLQVTKNSCSREWISLTCVLGALIRNGMGVFALFSICYVLLWIMLLNRWNKFMRFYVETLCQSCLKVEWFPLRCNLKFWYDMFLINSNSILFMILWKEEWHSVYVEILWFYVLFYIVGNTGCYS